MKTTKRRVRANAARTESKVQPSTLTLVMMVSGKEFERVELPPAIHRRLKLAVRKMRTNVSEFCGRALQEYLRDEARLSTEPAGRKARAA